MRIEGPVSQTPREAVEAYFRSRPRGSRLGAWASRQSEVIPSREILEVAMAEAELRFPSRGAGARALGRLLCRPPSGSSSGKGARIGFTTRLAYRRVEGLEGQMWAVERVSP